MDRLTNFKPFTILEGGEASFDFYSRICYWAIERIRTIRADAHSLTQNEVVVVVVVEARWEGVKGTMDLDCNTFWYA